MFPYEQHRRMLDLSVHSGDVSQDHRVLPAFSGPGQRTRTKFAVRIHYSSVKSMHISECLFSQIACAKDCTHDPDYHDSGHADCVLDL